MTVIDVGAQDSKVIHLAQDGRRTNFKMNRKCAAGTGAFLEEIALRLDLPVGELNGLAEQSTKDVSLGSFCTVFAATEILAKIRAGERVEDIVKGAFRSVVKRLLEMDTVQGQLVMTGGVVAHNLYLAKLVEQYFGEPVLCLRTRNTSGPSGPRYLRRSKRNDFSPQTVNSTRVVQICNFVFRMTSAICFPLTGYRNATVQLTCEHPSVLALASQWHTTLEIEPEDASG